MLKLTDKVSAYPFTNPGPGFNYQRPETAEEYFLITLRYMRSFMTCDPEGCELAHAAYRWVSDVWYDLHCQVTSRDEPVRMPGRAARYTRVPCDPWHTWWASYPFHGPQGSI